MNRQQTDNQSTKSSTNAGGSGEASWGPKLFLGVFVLVLVFFWWLLIYSGGVSGHHG